MDKQLKDILKKLMADYAEGLVEYRINTSRNWPQLELVSEEPVKVSVVKVDSYGEVRVHYRPVDSTKSCNEYADMTAIPDGVVYAGNGDVICLCKSKAEALKTVAKFQYDKAMERVRWAQNELDGKQHELDKAKEEAATLAKMLA